MIHPEITRLLAQERMCQLEDAAARWSLARELRKARQARRCRETPLIATAVALSTASADEAAGAPGQRVA
jgi:hypothetical protein